VIDRAREQALLEHIGEHVRLARRGLLLADALLSELI
jgi:hypothetical protein